MQNTGCFALAVLGMILLAIGGLGSHLLLHFRGRTLEAYCRLKGNRERFGKILDEQDDAQTACNYLFNSQPKGVLDTISVRLRLTVKRKPRRSLANKWFVP